ncbi:MAG TPA: hypothetical protein VH420_04685 [Gaiellaceae bacterium]
MKRFLAFAAFAAVAATLSGTADAARFKGVVVAKDAKRKALVTATKSGAVRTVRTRRYGAFRIGQRVVVKGARRPDATWTGSVVRRVGRTHSVRFGGVVVSSAGTRMIVSAGGSVFALRVTGLGTSGLANDGHFEAGDKVDVDADVKKGRLEAGSKDIDKTGHVESLVLEGIFLFTRGDGFDMAVVHRGLVHVSVPTEMVLPEFKAGDQIVVLVTVSGEGRFSLVKGKGEGKKSAPPGEATASGPLTVKTAFEVGVKPEGGEMLRCAIPAGLDLSMFELGQKVKLYCAKRDGRLVMKKLQSDRATATGDGVVEFYVEGLLTEASADAAAIGSVRCLNRAHLDLSPFVLGESALMGCRLADHEYRLFKLKNERAYVRADGDSSGDVIGYGVITEKTSSLAIRRDDGSTKACAVPGGMDLQGFRMGERVKIQCHSTGSAYSLVQVASENATANADGSGSFIAYGTVTSVRGDGLSVEREDHSVVSCGFPPATDMSAFPAGTLAKMRCVRHEGSYRLAELQSESAHITLEG